MRDQNLFVPATSACGLYKAHMTHDPKRKGRICACCDTILSIYNPTLLCSVHEVPDYRYHTHSWRHSA